MHLENIEGIPSVSLFVKVFCRLRPPTPNENSAENGSSSSCIKVANATEMILYSSEVSQSESLSLISILRLSLEREERTNQRSTTD